MVALYRPGPMDFIPSYIRRMHGEEPVEYRHPALEPIFRETYGVPVYQEQVMTAAVELAGYSAAEADTLRKAISKKEVAELEKHRAKFIDGAVARRMSADTAASIFEDWENFARYGFNRAHAAAYGTLAVQTAYLKANYPIEYMTGLLSVFRGNTDKVAGYIADCRRMGIPVLPPEVTASGIDFQIESMEQGGEGDPLRPGGDQERRRRIRKPHRGSPGCGRPLRHPGRLRTPGRPPAGGKARA